MLAARLVRRTRKILPVAGLIILACLGSYYRVFDSHELNTLDVRYRMRPPLKTTDKAVVIEIGNDSIEQLGQFPFDRSYHSAMVKALTQAGAKAVVFDIFFSEPDPKDEELAEEIALARNVYIPHVLNILQDSVSPFVRANGFSSKTRAYIADNAKGTGHINIIPDSDGKYRRVPLYINNNGRFVPYLAFKVSMDYFGINEKDVRLVPGKHIAFDPNHVIPLDEKSKAMINFAGPWGSAYAHYSYVDVLRSYIAGMSGEEPVMDLSVLKDKVCFIGLTADGTTDLHPNPLEPLYPSVGVHVEVFNSILQNAYIKRGSHVLNIILLLVFILMLSSAVKNAKPMKALGIFAGVQVFYQVLAVALFIFSGLWIDAFYPFLVLTGVYVYWTLRQYVRHWKDRLLMMKELQIARKIQTSFLPKAVPAHKRLDIAASMVTAKHVGGDLYDFLEFEPDKVGVMIGDVAGKGIPASLFMAMAVSAFKFFAKEDVAPEETMKQLNAKVKAESKSHLFITMFYCVFDMAANTAAFASAGHLPLLYVSGKKVSYLDVKDGLPIGMVKGRPYSGGKVKFQKDDVLIFYTDGITEARNPRGEMFEAEGLEALAKRHAHKSAQEIHDEIDTAIWAFQPKNIQGDDITLIVVKVR